MQQNKPYTNTISNILIVVIILALIIAFSSCASVKKDCQGRKHYRQEGGFYL